MSAGDVIAFANNVRLAVPMQTILKALRDGRFAVIPAQAGIQDRPPRRSQ